MRWVFFVGLWLFLAGIMVQALTAGQFIFGAATSSDAHASLGWPLAHMVAPLLLIISLLCRLGWATHVLAAVPFVLAAVVPVLAEARKDSPDVAAYHPLSALITFGLVLYLALHLRPMVGIGSQAPSTA